MIDRANALQVDLPLAAFFLAGFAVAWDWSITRSKVDLALVFACAGLVAGVKMSGPHIVRLCFGLAAALRAAHRGPTHRPEVRTHRERLAVAVAIALAAFSSARSGMD